MTKRLIALFVLAVILAAHAGDIIVYWSPSPSTNVSGYIIYCGDGPQNYTNSIQVGPVLSCKITDLEVRTTYYLAATAYSVIGVYTNAASTNSYFTNYLESEYSKELTVTTSSLCSEPEEVRLQW